MHRSVYIPRSELAAQGGPIVKFRSDCDAFLRREAIFRKQYRDRDEPDLIAALAVADQVVIELQKRVPRGESVDGVDRLDYPLLIHRRFDLARKMRYACRQMRLAHRTHRKTSTNDP